MFSKVKKGKEKEVFFVGIVLKDSSRCAVSFEVSSAWVWRVDDPVSSVIYAYESGSDYRNVSDHWWNVVV